MSFVLITGASAGIGEAAALEFSRQKKNLILLARRQDRLLTLKKKCQELGAGEVIIEALDLKKGHFENLKKYDISVLVNCAGLAKGVDLLSSAKPCDLQEMIDVNVSALIHLTQAILPSIIKNRGHIVNLGSVAGRLVYEGGAVYCATKFAVRAYSEGLRMDLKGSGVRVTNIEPGMVNTEFSLVRLGSQQKADAIYNDMVPLSAQDIAQSIAWCVGQPAHVNIQELVIYPTDQASVGQIVRGDKSVKNLTR